MYSDLLQRLLLAERYFNTPTYASKVREARTHFLCGRYDEAKKTLDQLPTKEVLLKELIEKLVNKSVYKTLKEILKGEKSEKYTALKGLSSLLTHTVISCEQGKTEYEILFPLLMEKINEIMYEDFK